MPFVLAAGKPPIIRYPGDFDEDAEAEKIAQKMFENFKLIAEKPGGLTDTLKRVVSGAIDRQVKREIRAERRKKRRSDNEKNNHSRIQGSHEGGSR